MARLFTLGKFYGETDSFSIAGAAFSEVRHERALAMPEHAHQAGHFCLLLEGSYVERSGPVTIAYEPLTVAFLPPNVPHADTVGEAGCRFFIIELQQRWLEAAASYGPIDAHLAELDGGDATWLAMRLHHEFHQRDVTSELTVESLLYELCGLIPRMRADEAAEPPWLRDTLERIRARFSEHLDLGELAADAGVHPTHLARVFRRYYGRPVGDYVAGLRIQHVCRRLAANGVSLRTIAHEAGFADQSHLTRVFKAMTGATPAAYRRGSGHIAVR